jgi:hypothetical protein
VQANGENNPCSLLDRPKLVVHGIIKDHFGLGQRFLALVSIERVHKENRTRIGAEDAVTDRVQWQVLLSLAYLSRFACHCNTIRLLQRVPWKSKGHHAPGSDSAGSASCMG